MDVVSTITAAKGSLELLSCLFITPAGEEKPALRGPVVPVLQPCKQMLAWDLSAQHLPGAPWLLRGTPGGVRRCSLNPANILPSPSPSLPQPMDSLGSPAHPKASVSSWTLLTPSTLLGRTASSSPPPPCLQTCSPPSLQQGAQDSKQPSVYCFLSGSSFVWHTSRSLTSVLHGHEEWVIHPPLKATALYSVLILLSRTASCILTACP